uniref:U1-type domain-containing protein n=1 Tax=Latimeria chalumnae TaxID=7897 RepID=H2ZZX8_LATCH
INNTFQSKVMKRPLSPTPSPESDVTEVSLESNDITDSRPGPSEHRMKREKKQQSFTLCEVCNIQLNSPAQAQIHYNGKSHQRRLKQLNNGKAPSNPGT